MMRVMGGNYDIVKRRSCSAIFQTSGNFATFRNLWDTGNIECPRDVFITHPLYILYRDL